MNQVKWPKINWASLKPDEIVAKLKEKGYQVSELGNGLYQISHQIKLSSNIRNPIDIKIIFNAKTGFPQSSALYRNGEKISENIMEQMDGKNIVYTEKFMEKVKEQMEKIS